MDIEVLALAVRFGVMALATFLAIVVWSRVRDVPWMLIVIGILSGYADILYLLLVQFGLLPDPSLSKGASAALAFVFPNLAWLFFSAAFLAMLSRRGRRR